MNEEMRKAFQYKGREKEWYEKSKGRVIGIDKKYDDEKWFKEKREMGEKQEEKCKELNPKHLKYIDEQIRAIESVIDTLPEELHPITDKSLEKIEERRGTIKQAKTEREKNEIISQMRGRAKGLGKDLYQDFSQNLTMTFIKIFERLSKLEKRK